MHGNGEIFVCNIEMIKIFLLQRSHQPQTIVIEYVSLVFFFAQMAKIAKIIRYFDGTSQVIIKQISDWRAIFHMLKYQWKATQSADFKWTDDLYLWGHGYSMDNKEKLFNKGTLNVIFQKWSGQHWQTACRKWVLFHGAARSSVWEARMTWAPP